MRKLSLLIFIAITTGCGNSLNGSVQTPLGTFTFASPNASPTYVVNVTK